MQRIRQQAFLREKIMQIGTAVLHCPEDHLANVQAVFARTLDFTEKKVLWLAIDKPFTCSDADLSVPFDIVLNYHKAGVPFDLDLLGEARMLVADEAAADLPSAVKAAAKKGKWVLRVSIIAVDYWEQKASLLSTMARKLQGLFHTSATAADSQEIYPAHQMSA